MPIAGEVKVAHSLGVRNLAQDGRDKAELMLEIKSGMWQKSKEKCC